MADNFVFTSPGVKFKERDLSYVTRNVGITTLGLVGETLKGPAFEPVFIQDKTQFSNRFGAQSTKRFSNGNLQYQLPYVANAYLDETNQLWVTRVLGLSGYDAGTAWAVTLNAGIDPTTIVAVSAVTNTNVKFGEPFPNQYLGVAITGAGSTGTVNTGFTKIQGTNEFNSLIHQFTVTSYTGSTGKGTVTDVVTLLSGTSYAAYENMVLAVVRSRAFVQDHANLPSTTVFDTKTLVVTGNTTNTGSGNLFKSFGLRASNFGYIDTGHTSGSTVIYSVSLDPNSSSFLPNVIGVDAKDKKTKIWTQAVYPELIKTLDVSGTNYPSGLTQYGFSTSAVASYAYGINNELITCTGTSYVNYKTQFKTPETPWVVSQLKGSTVDKLFKFISISDGDAANQEIKISIGNINPIALEFDIAIRDFYDTDASPNVLESYTKCSLIKGTTNYVAQQIGTSDGEYSLNSKYVMIELATEISLDSFPAGFEGYRFNNYDTVATNNEIIDPKTNMPIVGTIPTILYKKLYNDDDKINKVFLGISETAYVGSSGINQNFFNFNGTDTPLYDTHVNTKGYHMDSGATGTYDGFEFEVGAGQFQTVDDVMSAENPYYNIKTRKFTFVPAGGFDGWDVNRGINGVGYSRSYGDLYRANGIFDGVNPNVPPKNDFQAWETAIDTFSNPESVTINLFATPGINWSDNNIMVQDTIEMIEQQRTDTLYVIDSPDIAIDIQIGDGGKADVLAAQGVADLMGNANIDSSYACTYFPWIQMFDSQNNVNVYIPPTGEVVRAMAYTDNTAFPWFAPAGLTRGVTNAKKSKYKLSLEARDILYAGRINPMADFADAGTAIFGQKTLQVRGSALDRINVRRLLLQIKVLIANIAIRLVFEQNDQATIDQFLGKANPILDTIKRERGLTDFRIKMDDTNNTTESRDRNELYGEIFLKPTRAVEFIGITFTITPSGASFADVGA